MSYESSAKTLLWRPGWALLSEHRGLVRAMVRRELTNRYRGSVMGLAWSIVNPAVMIVIFTLIFSGIFGARFGTEGGHLGFAVYLFCGLLPWIALSEGVQRATTSLIEKVNLVKRVVFPLEALPVNVALAALVQQLIGMTVLLAASFVLLGKLYPTTLLLPLLLLPQLMITIGLGWLAASLGVFIRDVPQFSQLLLMTWMYLTPIFYPEQIIPARYRWLVEWNPMAPLIRSYRRILLEGRLPDWRGLAFTLLFAALCFVFGYWWFERTKRAFADVL
jgi:lipopolysaccharide transport system permease protein